MVSPVAAAAAVATAAAAVAVLIREGNVGEGTLQIVVEGVHGDIDVGGESTGEGEDHVPCDFRRAYSDNCR